MDIVASPTSTSAEEAFHFPTSVNSEQPRGRLQSHGNPSSQDTTTSSNTPSATDKPPVNKHLWAPAESRRL